MNFESIFTPYKARKLTEADIPGILNLYSENTEYFKHCPPNPNSKTVKEDLAALPPAKEAADKYFIGIFDGDSLIAVLDLIDRYPDNRTAFIGLFMVLKSLQRKGIHILQKRFHRRSKQKDTCVSGWDILKPTCPHSAFG